MVRNIVVFVQPQLSARPIRGFLGQRRTHSALPRSTSLQIKPVAQIR